MDCSTGSVVRIQWDLFGALPWEFCHLSQPIFCTWYLGVLREMTRRLPWVYYGHFFWAVTPFTLPNVACSAALPRCCLQRPAPDVSLSSGLKFAVIRAETLPSLLLLPAQIFPHHTGTSHRQCVEPLPALLLLPLLLW